MSRSPGASLALLCALILGPGGTLRAEAPRGEAALKSAAGELLEEGNRLYEVGKFEAALARYEAAYSTFASPKIFLNLGKVNQKLGRLAEAEGLLARFLKEAGLPSSAPSYKDAEERLASIREGLGSVVVDSAVLGAEIFIDGKAAGTVPREPIRALAGAHELVVQKAGYATYRQRIDVRAGGTITAQVELAPLELRAPVAPPPVVRVEAAAPSESGVWTEWWFWGAVVVVAAGAIGVSVALANKGGDFVPDSELGVTPTDQWRSL